MDLSDVLYVIDGSLEVARLPDGPGGEPVYEAVLYDNIHDPCRILELQPEPDSEWRYGLAKALGSDEPTSLGALIALIAGRHISYSFPIMWKSYDVTMRVPPSLVAGSPPINVRRPFAPPPQPEEQKTA